jgi:hypothetical protein
MSRQVEVTIKFTGSEEDGEEVIELLRLIAEVMKDRKNEENDDESIK